MKRALAAAGAAALAACLSGCASAPPPPPPAPERAPAAEPAVAPAAVEAPWRIAAKSVHVRENASTKAATVARLSRGARLTSFEEKDGWLHVKLADGRAGWIRRDLVKRDDGCLPDRRELLLLPPMLHMSEAGAPGAKGRVVVEADVDDKGDVKAVRVVKNETGSPERAETAKSEVLGVKFQPPVKKCRATGFTYVYTRTF
jgi:hypothetical protein